MKPSDTPSGASAPPHPLAGALADVLAHTPAPRVLVLGLGSGRNLPALLEVAAVIDVVESDEDRADAGRRRFGEDPRVRIVTALPEAPPVAYHAALSTHALQHGTPATIERSVAAVREGLAAGAPFYCTLGSKRDPRFGAGRAVARDTYAPLDGSEAGIAHAYFDETGARALFAGFILDDLREASAAESAGAWAHTAREAATLRHWFVRARRTA